MREVSFENFVHAVVVLNLGEKNAELHNVVHVGAGSFDQFLNIVEDLGRLISDVPRLCRSGVMRANSGNVREPIVNNDRRNELRAVRRLSLIVQLANRNIFVLVLLCDCSFGKQRCQTER
jgi:hypothetical protein